MHLAACGSAQAQGEDSGQFYPRPEAAVKVGAELAPSAGRLGTGEIGRHFLTI